jgi:hypothetical protein
VTRGPGAVALTTTRHRRFGMSGTVSASVCCGAILLAMAVGYVAGFRRRPRHGSMQLRGPRHRR